MTVKELKNRLNSIDGNAKVGFSKYGYVDDIGKIQITISEDGAVSVVLYEAEKEMTEQPES